MKKQILFLILPVILTTTACRSRAVRHQETLPVPAEMQVTPPPAEVEAHAEPPAQAADTHAPKHSSKSAHHDEADKGTPAETAFSWMKNGNKRFVKNRLRNDGQKRSDVIRLAKGQQPHTIVLSCSDSRVPPEIVFDQKLGEIFVVRTAGQALDHNVIGSIEYAVAHLNSHHLLVMGHTQCGAVKAALSTMDGADAGTPSLNHLVKDLHPHFKRGGPLSSDFGKESFANARGVAADLIQRSPYLRDAVANGKLTIHSALYHLDSGVVDFE